MGERNTDTDDGQTNDHFDTTLDSRAVDLDAPDADLGKDGGRGPPIACSGCGADVVDLDGGLCPDCHDRERPDDDFDPDVIPDGGRNGPHPTTDVDISDQDPSADGQQDQDDDTDGSGGV